MTSENDASVVEERMREITGHDDIRGASFASFMIPDAILTRCVAFTIGFQGVVQQVLGG